MFSKIFAISLDLVRAFCVEISTFSPNLDRFSCFFGEFRDFLPFPPHTLPPLLMHFRDLFAKSGPISVVMAGSVRFSGILID